MACVRSGQARLALGLWPECPRVSGIKHDFACTFAGHLVVCSLSRPDQPHGTPATAPGADQAAIRVALSEKGDIRSYDPAG
jgi:hypothetical protein